MGHSPLNYLFVLSQVSISNQTGNLNIAPGFNPPTTACKNLHTSAGVNPTITTTGIHILQWHLTSPDFNPQTTNKKSKKYFYKMHINEPIKNEIRQRYHLKFGRLQKKPQTICKPGKTQNMYWEQWLSHSYETLDLEDRQDRCGREIPLCWLQKFHFVGCRSHLQTLDLQKPPRLRQNTLSAIWLPYKLFPT